MTEFVLKGTIGRWLQNPAFRHSNLLYAIQNSFRYLPREQIMRTVMEFAAESDLPGDYLEFGVFQGHTFATAFHFAKRQRLANMRFYAFDSFEGLPKVDGVDAAGYRHRHFEQGQIACDLAQFKQHLARSRVNLSDVEIVEGWFSQTLSEETTQRLPLKQASVVWIDCDLYESTVSVLDFLTNYVHDGTVLVFDDWFCFRGSPDRGEQRAFREWLQRNPHIGATAFHTYGWGGNSFILNMT